MTNFCCRVACSNFRDGSGVIGILDHLVILGRRVILMNWQGTIIYCTPNWQQRSPCYKASSRFTDGPSRQLKHYGQDWQEKHKQLRGCRYAYCFFVSFSFCFIFYRSWMWEWMCDVLRFCGGQTLRYSFSANKILRLTWNSLKPTSWNTTSRKARETTGTVTTTVVYLHHACLPPTVRSIKIGHMLESRSMEIEIIPIEAIVPSVTL